MDLNDHIGKRGHNKYLIELKHLARKNRKNPTKAESLIWNVILKEKFTGVRFLRQKPINRFILDFYCPQLLLAIEIDGDSHDLKENYDMERDRFLNNMGIITIRYTNEQVLNDLENVYMDLEKQIKLRNPLGASHHLPLQEGDYLKKF